jgi:quinol monooxygenase YgiN
MIVITAAIRAKEGKEDELIALMKELVAEVRKNEPGNLAYSLLRSRRDKNLFMVYEKYASGEAMQAHMTSAHFQAASKKMGGVVDGGLGIETYEVVAE